MALKISPDIVVSNLVVCWDSANIKSYPGSGSSVTDISKNDNTLSLFVSPSFDANNGGAIIFNGANSYASIADSADVRFPHDSEWSFDFSVNILSYTNSFPTFLQKGNSAANGFVMYFYTNNKIQWKHNNAEISIAPWVANTPMVLSATYDLSTVRFYLNGEICSNTSTMAGTDSSSALNFGINQYSNYRLHQFKKYNRALSNTEIKQNFNAIRGRFGL